MRYLLLNSNKIGDQLFITVSDFVQNKTVSFTLDELKNSNLTDDIKSFILNHPELVQFF
ncbi:hypothetical protein LCL95_17045 [Bacillus timonensis]|nr:hypothetical protein [Bacillus timonensis]